MPALFDMNQRSMRRDRAARIGPELFLHEHVFRDCLERLALMPRRFKRALLIGCPDPNWPERLRSCADDVDVRDPGQIFADRSNGRQIIEDAFEPQDGSYDLILAIGVLDTVNDLPLALRLFHHALSRNALFLAVFSGGDTLPQLRSAMRKSDALYGIAAAHVHPRIEASAVAPLLAAAGFVDPVVDVDRIAVSYRSLERLIGDMRAMGATNILDVRPRFLGRLARAAAMEAFARAGDGDRTVETFEIIHVAAWTGKEG